MQFELADSLEKEGLPREAANVYDVIFDRAIQDKKYIEQLRAIDSRMVNQYHYEENALVKVIHQLKSDTKNMDFPVNQIAHSILGNLYWQYYQQNRWRIHQRTTLQKDAGDNLETWDLKRIISETILEINYSLENPSRLYETPIDTFKYLLQGDSTTRKYRPTVLDLLSHRALTLYANDETGLTSPANVFSVCDPCLFSLSSDFVTQELTSNDSLNLIFKSLQIFQQLTHYHLKNKAYEALLDLELNRLNFVYNKSTHQQKDLLYKTSLLKLSEQNSNPDMKIRVQYQLAYFFYTLESGGSTNYYKKASRICKQVLQQYPHHKQATLFTQLLQKIEEPSLSLQSEKLLTPDVPNLVKINYKNLDTVYFKVYKLWSNDLKENRISQLNKLDYYQQKTAILEWSQIIPPINDYRTHQIEVPIKSLEKGFYTIIASDNKDLKQGINAIATLNNSTHLLLLSKTLNDNKIRYSIYNKQTGMPTTKAKLQIYKSEYDNKDRKYKNTLTDELFTDNNGYVDYRDNSSYYRRKALVVSYQGDTLILWDYNSHRKPHISAANRKAILYTDRSIYRPGQTIYFKGLMLDMHGDTCSIIANKSNKVSLHDPNGQELGNLQVKTNEYGTFSGSFTIPTGLLNGRFSLRCNYAYQTIRVEEYKRPTFEINYRPITHTYGFNDSVKIKGSAKAYAGYPISHAQISYRISRKTESRWQWYHHHFEQEDKVISVGNTTTDKDGDFTVAYFTADHDIKDRNQIYAYHLTVDITDDSGETKTATHILRVSQSPLLIKANLPDVIFNYAIPALQIETNNINGGKVDADMCISTTQLIAPQQLLFNRAWETPDQFLYEEEEFRRLFPNRVYKQENDPNNWKQGKTVFTSSHKSNADNKGLQKALSKLNQGYYLVKISAKDSNKQEANWQKIIHVISSKPQMPLCLKDWIIPVKTSGEPGDIAEFWVASLNTEAPIRYELLHGDKVIVSKDLWPGKKVSKIKIPITEEYRGGFAVQFAQVAHGQAFTSLQEVSVPYTNKKLDISFISFRNKLLPGEQEQWKLSIKNKNGEKETAEMMATLYDASLDAFAPLKWQSDFINIKNHSWHKWNAYLTQRIANTYYISTNILTLRNQVKVYETLHLRYPYYGTYNSHYQHSAIAFRKQRKEALAGTVSAKQVEEISIVDDDIEMEENLILDEEETIPSISLEKKENKLLLPSIATRKNFNETAFFYPHLQTNEKGEVSIDFTIPESLSRWNMKGFAHTKDFKTGSISQSLITQKDVSIQVNTPRFLRENDTLYFVAKINNLSENTINGKAYIQLYNAINNQAIDSLLLLSDVKIPFSIAKKQSQGVRWKLVIPAGIQAVHYKVMAQADKHSDGEENILPVLVNSLLVTESLPFMLRPNEIASYRFDKMVDQSSSTLRNESYTIEYTSNPTWYAIQAMPYLMEYPYECAEQVFSRFFANTLSYKIINSSPRIREVFKTWETIQPDALSSNLEKNQELKELLIQETPWLRNAQNESERKKRLSLLFDLNQMHHQMQSALHKLEDKQTNNGGFAWFQGMPDNRYITQHITMGLAQLQHLHAIGSNYNQKVNHIISKAIKYLDERIIEDYQHLQEQEKKGILKMDDDHLTNIHIHYLYCKSFFSTVEPNPSLSEAYKYFYHQAKKYALTKDIYSQAMIAITLERNHDKKVAQQVVKSLSNRAIRSKEMGMYWSNNRNSYYWYQAPIETQAMLIEAFHEVSHDTTAIEEMKIWLLRNKQTSDWKTTKATVAACYALILQDKYQMNNTSPLQLTVGGKPLEELKNILAEAGTGYVKTSFTGDEIKPDMGKLKIHNTHNGVAWGAAYWQYFEELDKITSAQTNLKITKRLYVKEYAETGVSLKEIQADLPIKVGDEVVVRIEIFSDRDYEYIHLKDMRASGFEPMSTVSQYKYRDGLGYYESVKDASQNFFIDHMRKGVYVFEYSLRAVHAGYFSNGITTMQCMYAPEFSAHSKGLRINIVKP
ncbi:alpha-2-macroglobulin family protein [Saccharicrinis fermentans]|nr:MG2 domain-containing protein [Saccharicrinis fermentans]